MKPTLDIREQVRLPMARQAAIAVDGIHHRLFRSMLTLVVVTLAVAFLSNVLAEDRIARSCQRGVRELAVAQHTLGHLAAFVDADLTPRLLAQRLADLPPESWMLAALAPWLNQTPATLAAVQHDADAMRRYEAWFDGLAPGHRRLLVGKIERDAAFVRLADPELRRGFEITARGIPLKLPAGLAEFLDRRAGLLDTLTVLAARQNEAGARLRAAMADQPFADWLAVTPADAAAPLLRAQGLDLPGARLTTLLTAARERAEERRLVELLRAPGLAAAWREAFGGVFDQQAVLDIIARDSNRAAWLTARAAQLAPGVALDIAATAGRIAAARHILETDNRLAAAYGERTGLGGPMFWLVVVSFLVCVAGITNAMLISVIERFREIATMKCLGALNGFIARLFLIEAAFLGLVGGLFGVLLGMALGIGRMTAAYGHWVTTFFPGPELLSGALVALVSGLVLTTLSAMYPAFSAARMLPMEAMRIE